MIQRKLIEQKIKEFQIQEFIKQNLKQVGLSHSKLQMTPLGEKIVIFASRPGLIVGRKGQSIKKLTNMLKKKFNLENPQIEINEVENLGLDPDIVAERISNSLERFGSMRFKGIGHKVMEDVMNSGALGVEILLSGKIPSSRAKRWRFYQGYIKKSGDIALKAVKKAYTTAELKTGTIGIQVRIMSPDVRLPDDIKFVEETVEEVKKESEKDSKTETPAKKEKKPKKKKTVKKTPKKKVEEKAENEDKGNKSKE